MRRNYAKSQRRESSLTSGDDAGVDPALSILYTLLRPPELLQDGDAARPDAGRLAACIISAPVADQHSVVVFGISLKV